MHRFSILEYVVHFETAFPNMSANKICPNGLRKYLNICNFFMATWRFLKKSWLIFIEQLRSLFTSYVGLKKTLHTLKLNRSYLIRWLLVCKQWLCNKDLKNYVSGSQNSLSVLIFFYLLSLYSGSAKHVIEAPIGEQIFCIANFTKNSS